MHKDILIEVDNKIATIILNKPSQLNPLTPEIMKELMRSVKELENHPGVKVIMITGKGDGFSAGADYAFLDALIKMGANEIKRDVYQYFAGAVKAIKLCSKPTIAVVRGPAIGAGCEIAIACDFRIVSETARFKEVWAKLGLISPLGGLFLLPRMIGLTRATEMFLTGRTVGGPEAEVIGLANRCVADDQLEKVAYKYARELAEGAPLAQEAIKACLIRGMESTLHSEWETNTFAQATLLTSDDFKEAVAAIKEFRKPVFKGN